jgi:dipeptidase E
MRLYLSSYRLGDDPGRLTALLRTPRPAAVVANAVDMLPADLRAEGVASEVAALAGLGLTAEEIDLRAYFGQAERLAARYSAEETPHRTLRDGEAIVVG